MRIIVAFTGPKGCGKSTAAKHLIESHDFERHYFAKPLKEMVKCLGMDERHVNGDLKEVPCEELCGQSPRWAMQTLGTEWGRDLIHPQLWVNAWKNTLPDCDIVCDDLRFPNELEVLREKGGIIIDIARPGFDRDQSHESEAHALPFDYQIDNSGSPEDMIAQIEDILTKITFVKNIEYGYGPYLEENKKHGNRGIRVEGKPDLSHKEMKDLAFNNQESIINDYHKNSGEEITFFKQEDGSKIVINESGDCSIIKDDNSPCLITISSDMKDIISS